MILTVASLYSRLLLLFTQVIDLVVPGPSYQVYQNSDYDGKINSFLLDSGPTALDDLSDTKKERLNKLILSTR